MAEHKRTVGVRYCGGCNPRYDRVALVTRLAAACPFAVFSAAVAGIPQDVLLVVCGCPACCASQAGLEHRLGRVLISAEIEDQQAEALLRAAAQME